MTHIASLPTSAKSGAIRAIAKQNTGRKQLSVAHRDKVHFLLIPGCTTRLSCTNRAAMALLSVAFGRRFVLRSRDPCAAAAINVQSERRMRSRNVRMSPKDRDTSATSGGIVPERGVEIDDLGHDIRRRNHRMSVENEARDARRQETGVHKLIKINALRCDLLYWSFKDPFLDPFFFSKVSRPPLVRQRGLAPRREKGAGGARRQRDDDRLLQTKPDSQFRGTAQTVSIFNGQVI